MPRRVAYVRRPVRRVDRIVPPPPTVPAVTYDRGLASALAAFLLRYGLAVVLAWTGAMKFTSYEAAAIHPLVATSPLTSWVYHFWTIPTAARLFGLLDLTTALLIASRPLSPRASMLGSAIAAVTCAVTSTFLLSAPGWAAELGGFPYLSYEAGQAFIKDVVLVGAALWCWSDARVDK